MSALEVCRWEDQFAEAWTEKRPALKSMSDAEILDWLDEYADSVTQAPVTVQTSRTFTIRCELISPTHGESLRDAVQLAAAKLEEQS